MPGAAGRAYSPDLWPFPASYRTCLRRTADLWHPSERSPTSIPDARLASPDSFVGAAHQLSCDCSGYRGLMQRRTLGLVFVWSALAATMAFIVLALGSRLRAELLAFPVALLAVAQLLLGDGRKG